MELFCGVDEAGRGPLCGPVFAAAVILDPSNPISGLADSKKLSPARRSALEAEIKAKALAWSVASASVDEIDSLNILAATMLAMKRAVEGLSVQPAKAVIDGNRCPSLSIPAEAIVKGDAKVPAISAASILAKTARDADTDKMHEQYPQYGLVNHKGYGTAEHMEALRKFGPTPHHRKTFAPVAALLPGKAEEKPPAIKNKNKNQLGLEF